MCKFQSEFPQVQSVPLHLDRIVFLLPENVNTYYRSTEQVLCEDKLSGETASAEVQSTIPDLCNYLATSCIFLTLSCGPAKNCRVLLRGFHLFF